MARSYHSCQGWQVHQPLRWLRFQEGCNIIYRVLLLDLTSINLLQKKFKANIRKIKTIKEVQKDPEEADDEQDEPQGPDPNAVKPKDDDDDDNQDD